MDATMRCWTIDRCWDCNDVKYGGRRLLQSPHMKDQREQQLFCLLTLDSPDILNAGPQNPRGVVGDIHPVLRQGQAGSSRPTVVLFGGTATTRLRAWPRPCKACRREHVQIRIEWFVVVRFVEFGGELRRSLLVVTWWPSVGNPQSSCR